MVQCKPQGQRAGAATKAGHCQRSGEHQQDPAAQEIEALVPTVWTSPPDNVGYEVPITTVKKMERTITPYMKKMA